MLAPRAQHVLIAVIGQYIQEPTGLYVENTNTTPPHLEVLVRLDSRDGSVCYLQFLFGGIAQCGIAPLPGLREFVVNSRNPGLCAG